jgi:aspartate-semialdehyde dehydrogenase
MRTYDVAVVGATGLVGRTMLKVLEERDFPVGKVRLLASSRSAGQTIHVGGKDFPVEELRENSFAGIDIALFSAGADVSHRYAPLAVKAGVVVIDNSSAYRMDPAVPLVVPEVNPGDIGKHRGIISNPNCSTIQMVVALKPLHDRWKIRRVVVSTYQSVTGAGKSAVDQLENEIARRTPGTRKLPQQIAYNVIPQVDIFLEGGNTKEEMKMVHETARIMGDATIRVTATCVRVPVIGGHSESVNVEFERPYELEDVITALRDAPGIELQDDTHLNLYPMPIGSHGLDEVFVGRIRRDPTIPNGLNLWIVSDNLRKGAATNAVQIAETLIARNQG